jgi:hypothetical protein
VALNAASSPDIARLRDDAVRTFRMRLPRQQAIRHLSPETRVRNPH